ncbi:hypothetical protein TRIUR3_05716 [Triticum urartu]|uniref:Uncharacterized protein n=2 Tax=Triticum urartu TaxID=4572 RepID=M7YRA2_TRIUA|nr:hypothetical protein TRIUR3_05716 [Triticum urartu]
MGGPPLVALLSFPLRPNTFPGEFPQLSDPSAPECWQSRAKKESQVYPISPRFASHGRELAEWLGLLAAKGILDLVLVNDEGVAKLPTDILRCASLQRLFLGFFTFPDTAALSRGVLGPHTVHGHLCLRASVLPRLQELGMFACSISEWDLLYMLDCSPVLEKLTFVFSGTPDAFHLRCKSLRCVVFLLEAPRRGDDRSIVMIKIACVPNLRALGFLEPRFHRLQIGDNNINPGTVPSPSTVVPSVNILALKVNFGVLRDVKMTVAYLGCFPNIDTLHIELNALEKTMPSSGRSSLVECIKSHLKKMVFHKYRGKRSELEFLKFISRKAQELQTLYVLLNRQSLTSVSKQAEMTSKLVDLSEVAWSCDCKIMVLGPEIQSNWSIQKASDLTVDDPFH